MDKGRGVPGPIRGSLHTTSVVRTVHDQYNRLVLMAKNHSTQLNTAGQQGGLMDDISKM